MIPGVKGYAKSSIKWALRQSYYRDSVSKPKVEERPFLIRFDITNRCNQWCKKCFYPAYAESGVPGNHITVDDFGKISEMVLPYTYYLQIPFGFEALVHPQFEEILSIADQYIIPNTGVSTNGSLLSGKKAEAILESRVTAVSISIDSIDRHIYTLLRGRDHLDKVLQNTEEFCREKKRRQQQWPNVMSNTIIMRSNVKVLPEILKKMISIGVDEPQFFHCEPMNLSNDESMLHEPELWNQIHDEMGQIIKDFPGRVYLPPKYQMGSITAEGSYDKKFTQNEDISEFETAGSQNFPDEEINPYPEETLCVCPWMVMIIDSWGNVAPCAHRPEPYMNLLRDGLDGGFNSLKYLKLRKSLLKGKYMGACATCHSKSSSSDPLRRKITRSISTKEETGL